MREYILYAILIFLPIGYIMSLFLCREGLAKKHITIFVATAMIMVISFPISAERLGIFNTGLIYVLLLLIITWYFINTNQLNYLYKQSVNENINEGLIDLTLPVAIKDALVNNEETPLVTAELDNTMFTRQDQEIISTQEYIEPTVEIKLEDVFEENVIEQSADNTMVTGQEQEITSTREYIEPTVEIKLEDVFEENVIEQSADNIMVTGQEQEITSTQEYIEPTVEIELEDVFKEDETSVLEAAAAREEASIPESSTTENPVSENVPLSDEQVTETTPESMLPQVSTDDIPDNTVIDNGDAATDLTETLSNEENEETIESDIASPDPDIIEDNISVSSDEQIVNDIGIHEELSIDELVLEVPKDISPVLMETPEENMNLEVDTAIISDEKGTSEQAGNLTSEKQQEVINFIDKAFAIKSLDLREAANNFQAALDITKNNELTYLLTIELLEDYKDIGMYDKAIQVLSDFIDRKAAAPDIIHQMASNLIYLQIMINELEKLGTPNLPFSTIPRWIRLKVAEEIKLLDN